jgi:ADP-ribose pyrophosphatase
MIDDPEPSSSGSPPPGGVPLDSAFEPTAAWERLGTRLLHDGPYLSLHQDRVRRPDSGTETVYEYIAVADAVRVIALNDQHEVALVEEAPYPTGSRDLFLPGGRIGPDENPETAARELTEGTGWRPGVLTYIGAIHPLPAVTSAMTRLFLATGLQRGTFCREFTAASPHTLWLPLGQAVAAVDAGRIREAGTVTGLLLAHRHLSGSPR